MKKACKQCGQKFEIFDEDLKFYEKVSPVFDGKKHQIPPPKICPVCRQQRRMAFRNERKLYKRKCDLCAKDTLSMYSTDKPFPVYCPDCWWGDKWDAVDFARDFDFDKSFFEQFVKLRKEVPRLALVNKQAENSEYCNYSFANKNCYLLFGSHYEEDCMYGRYSTKNRDCLDYFWLYESELCYECVFSGKCYKCVYLDHCVDCNECCFSFDLRGCKNCLFSHGLRNKRYYIFNKKHSKEEYEDYFKKLKMTSFEQWKKLIAGWEKYKSEKAVFRDNYQTNCQDCEGNNLQNSKNLKHCFSCTKCEDCWYGFQMDETYSSIDNSHMGYDKCELCYNDIGCSGTFNCLNCDSCWHDSDLYYCNLCFSSKNCFGCIGMRHNEYCILNKQYSKEEYEKVVGRIVEKMMETSSAGGSSGEWGKFYPYEISPFAYNETVAIEYFPLKKEEVESRGWKWRDELQGEVEGEALEEIPDDIGDVGDDICEKALKCEVTGRPYKILPRELGFYRRLGVPVPRRSPDQRQMDRLELANPWKLWDRKCMKCGKEVRTTFSPDREEKIYCEECYMKEVY